MAKSILREYAQQHNKIRDLLIENEVIFHDDVEKILGKRKWKSRTDEIIEINKKEEQQKALEGKKDSNDDPYAADFQDEPTTKTVDSPKVDDASDDDDAGTPPPFTKH